MKFIQNAFIALLLTICLKGFCWDCSDPCYSFYAGVEEGYMTFNVPRAFTGSTATIAGVESFNDLTSPKHVGSNYTQVVFGGTFPYFYLEGFGLLFDDSTEKDFNFTLASALSINFPAINGADAAGIGAGFGAGSVVTGSLEDAYSYAGIGFRFSPYFNFFLLPYLEFDFSKLIHNYVTLANIFQITIPFTQVLSNSLNERLDTSYYDLGIGFSFYRFFSAFFVSGHAGIYASYVRSRLTAEQSNVFAFAAAGELFTVSNFVTHTVSDHDFTHKFKGELEVGYEWNHFTLSIVGHMENWGFTPAIDNPIYAATALQHPVRIRDSHTFLTSIGAKLSVLF